MKTTPLSQALRDKAATIEDTQTAELIQVLAYLLEGRTLHKAFGAPGDWGYGRPIGDGVLEMLNAGSGDHRLADALVWSKPELKLPNDERTVIVAHGTEGAVNRGYHDEGRWYFVNVGGQIADVFAWADLPAAPARLCSKGGAL